MERPPDPYGWHERELAAPHAQADKAARVRHMFDRVAPRYALVNRVFSAGRDAAWRRRAVALVGSGPDDAVLDVACGTGDFLRVFAGRAGRPRHLVGCDFSHGMLQQAAACPHGDGLHWIEADALRLPLRSESFTVVSCAFGARNFQDLDRGLGEMGRILRPGGRVVILEFTRPGNRLVRAVYEWYARRIMARAASWVSGDRTGAYRYLPRSVVSFLSAGEMCARLERAGFGDVRATRMSLGIVTIYVGTRKSTTDG